MARGAKDQEGQRAQVPPTRQTGAESATGMALQAEEREIPQGEDAGSKVEIEGGDIRPDVESPEPIGAQAEPARFTSNGQLPHNHVPTPAGSMPVGATGLSVEDARDRVADLKQRHDDWVNRDIRRQRIPAETVSRLHPAELRAIAGQRGYDLGEGGTRSTRDAFLRAQDADEGIEAAADEDAPKARGKKASARKTRR